MLILLNGIFPQNFSMLWKGRVRFFLLSITPPYEERRKAGGVFSNEPEDFGLGK